MGIKNENWVDDTVWEFGRLGFWLVHLIGIGMLFFMGMRFAVRKAPIPIILYRMLRTMLQH